MVAIATVNVVAATVIVVVARSMEVVVTRLVMIMVAVPRELGGVVIVMAGIVPVVVTAGTVLITTTVAVSVIRMTNIDVDASACVMEAERARRFCGGSGHARQTQTGDGDEC